jgi:hypothetical protein
MSEPMNLQASDLEKLNNLYLMRSLLTNMQTNIYLIEQGASGQIITVNNANLYQLAAQYYGDATKWNTIAQANGLIDPVVQATISIEVFSLFLTFEGYAQSDQTIHINLTVQQGGAPVSTLYSYQVTDIDSLITIAQRFATLIPGATSVDNVLHLPPYINIETDVARFVTLTIPQTAPDNGAILQS